jgi:ubiquinone biosynthesis protein COQ4
MVEVSKADYEYFNGAIRKIATDSSVLISSSRYLNNAPLRELIAQEMLRENGADLPNTAYIPEVAQILHNMEDMPTIFRLFEEEKQRLPDFKRWLDRRLQSDFKVDDVKHCKPGTLGAVIHDFLANSGYNNDVFFQGMKVDSDYTFYLKERAFTHDIEHMVTGFEPNHGGEIALIAANLYACYNYFRPELAAYFSRISAYLRAKTYMKSSLYYPESFKVVLEAERIGMEQGRNWKMPLMMVPWREMVDRPLTDIRAEFGITDVLPAGYWSWTTDLVQASRASGAPAMAIAAE